MRIITYALEQIVESIADLPIDHGVWPMEFCMLSTPWPPFPLVSPCPIVVVYQSNHPNHPASQGSLPMLVDQDTKAGVVTV